jgi:hypothetical protein
MVRLAAYRAAHPSARQTGFIGRTDTAEEKYVAARMVDAERIAATWTAYPSDADEKASEFVAFADAMMALSNSTTRRSAIYSSMPAPLNLTQKSWCGLHAAFARAVLAEPDDSAVAEDEFRAMLVTAATDVSRRPSSDELIAVEALSRLASIRPLQPSTLEAIASNVDREDDLSKMTPTHTLLDKVAAVQPLSDRLRDKLLEKLRSPNGGLDSIEAVRILASNIRFLAKEQQTEVIDWLGSHSAENRTMSDVQEALGLVSITHSLDARQVHILEEQLPRASLFAIPQANYRGELVLTAGGETAAVALGRVGQISMLSEDTLQRLRNLAIARKSLNGREEILKGLAANWYGTETNIPATALNRLKQAEGSEDWRSLEIDVAAIKVQSMEAKNRQLVLKTLTASWVKETEPELRIGLARLIASASIPGQVSKLVTLH